MFIEAIAGFVASIVLVACLAPPDADVEGPTIVASTLYKPRTVEVEVLPRVVIEFSEPMDPAGFGPGGLVIAPWEEVGECRVDPVCERGSCERGRCLEDPLSSRDLDMIDGGAYTPEDAIVPLRWTLGPGDAGEDSRLEIAPLRPLTPHWRYSVVVGGARDRGGAPLVDEEGVASRWRRDLVTAHEGSSGPEPRLVEPASGAAAVPINLQRVVTSFARPVALDGDQGGEVSLVLEDSRGGLLRLIEPRGCAAWPAEFCLEWRPERALDPSVQYRVAGGTLRDRHGRPATRPGASDWFATSSAADTQPPTLAGATVELRGRCVYGRVQAQEPLVVSLSLASGAQVSVFEEGSLTLALRLPDDGTIAPGDALEVTLDARDLAGNAAGEVYTVAAGDSFAAPPLVISEVLGNPAGSEPGQEFVELVDRREQGAAVIVAGLQIADVGWEEVAASLAEDRPGDAIPEFSTQPGQRTVIVGSGYVWGDPADPDPAEAATVVTLDSSIGEGGLKNAGEPVSVFINVPAGDPVLVDSRGAPPESLADNGQSVVTSPLPALAYGCDRADGWIPHPQGGSSPGLTP